MNPARPSEGTRIKRRDQLVACALGIATLALYVSTLLPHIGGTEDTTKFQYLGSVLGTGHPPGYPLYVVVSYAFSWLPVGTLAYRMNLMSACFAAVTVMLAFHVARRLGAHRVIAGAVAVALGTGPAFWFNATIAEVYSLNTVLWTGAVLKLVDWRTGGRDRDLYLATMFVALGLGHHLTILGIFPAALACLLLSGRRWFRPRLVLVCAGILLCGLAQYGYIWIRSLQGSPYLEVRATSLPRLIQVMTARSYADAMFGVDAASLVRERVPLMWRLLTVELGWVGVATVGIGAVSLLARDRAVAALLGLGAVTVWILVANYVLADIGGFMLPAYVSLWLLSAAGFERLRTLVADRFGRVAATATVMLAVAFAASHVAGNYRISNRRDQVSASRFFAAVFEQLPPSAGIIIEDYTPEQMLRYGAISGDFKREGPPPVLMTSDPTEVQMALEQGTPVYALPRPAAALRGMGFATEPVRLLGPSLGDFLESVDDHSVLAVAATVRTLPNEFSRRFRGAVVRPPGSPRMLALGVMTSRGDASAIVDGLSAERVWPAGEAIPGTDLRLAATVRAAVADGMPALWIGEREIVSRDGDVLVVVLHRDGRIDDVREFSASTGFRDFLPAGEWDLSRVTHAGICLAMGGGDWHDIMPVSQGVGVRGRLDNYQPFDASMTLYLSSTWPLSPKLGEFAGGCQRTSRCPDIAEPSMEVMSYKLDTPQDRERLAADANRDGLDVEWPSGTAHVSRAHVTANDQGDFVTWWLAFGGVPSRVVARARTDDLSERRGGVCAAPPLALFQGSETTEAFSPLHDSVIDFGGGWHVPEGNVRWTADPTAVLIVPLARSGQVRVELEGSGSGAAAVGATLRLSVNGYETEARALDAQTRIYEWTVPASSWRSGLNHLAIQVSGPERRGSEVYRGVAVREMRFALVE